MHLSPIRIILGCFALLLFGWITFMFRTLGQKLFIRHNNLPDSNQIISTTNTAIISISTNAIPNNKNNAAAGDVTTSSSAADPRFMILNLRRRDDRWRCVSKEFIRHGIHPTRIEAVDAKIAFAPSVRRNAIQHLHELSSSQKSSLLDDTGINTGHLATFLTHVSALRAIVRQNLDIGCIFEDDVALIPTFVDTFNEILQELPRNWDLLVLSMYCHAGWKTCALNNKLEPVSAHLKPVLAFMSGAGYCLNARSAQQVLDTIPCTAGPCGVAIDGYLSSLAQRRKLTAYRAIDLPVIIPQDLMKLKKKGGNAGSSIHVEDKDCYSRFDSDIAAWWKPEQKRKSTVCLFDRNENENENDNRNEKQQITLQLGTRSSRLSLGGEARVHMVEGEIMEIHRCQHLFHTWKVRNVENTMYIYTQVGCVIVVSDDLWRGKSVTFYNVGSTVKGGEKRSSSQSMDVWWGDENGLKKKDSSWLQRALRGGSKTKTTIPIKHGTVDVDKSFHIFLPDFKRSLIVVPKGEVWKTDELNNDGGGHFEHVTLVQSLSTRCNPKIPIQSFVRSSESIGSCSQNYHQIHQTDILHHDISSGSFHTTTLVECCRLCEDMQHICGGVVFRSDIDDLNCYMKDQNIRLESDHIRMSASTACVRKGSR